MRYSLSSLLAVTLLAACNYPASPTTNVIEPMETEGTAEVPQIANAPAAKAVAAPAPVRPDPAVLEGLSPRQRRAYETGYADCRAGRYEPDPWPEAYRIGCAAANDVQ